MKFKRLFIGLFTMVIAFIIGTSLVTADAAGETDNFREDFNYSESGVGTLGKENAYNVYAVSGAANPNVTLVQKDNLDVLNRGYECFFYKIRQLRAVFKIIDIKK